MDAFVVSLDRGQRRASSQVPEPYRSVPVGRAGLVEQDVRRLDIAMEEAALVGVLQGVGDLEADAGDVAGVGETRGAG